MAFYLLQINHQVYLEVHGVYITHDHKHACLADSATTLLNILTLVITSPLCAALQLQAPSSSRSLLVAFLIIGSTIIDALTVGPRLSVV
jgi:hypothetical protein